MNAEVTQDAVIRHAGREGLVDYREAEIARIAAHNGKTEAEVRKGFARWRSLAPLIGWLGKR